MTAAFTKKVRLGWEFVYHFTRSDPDSPSNRPRLKSACGLTIAQTEAGNRLNSAGPCPKCLRALGNG